MPPATRVERLGPGPSSEALACALAEAPEFVWLEEGVLAAWPDRSLRSFPGDPDPLPRLSALLAESPPRHLVLAAGYDLGARMDRFFQRAKDDLGEPELEARRYPAVLFLEEGEWRLSVLPGGEDAGRHLKEALARAEGTELPRAPSGLVPERNFTREGYLAAVREAKRLIVEGEVYQLNLAQRFRVRTHEAPLAVYRRLRRISPAPYAAFLDWGGRAILSSSPELFLEMEGPRVVTRPIKGTRPRGRTPEEDARLLADLERSEKDRAELAMIVDLERNDLGRVCETGSVAVERTRDLESFATVHHAVATVSGRLREGEGLVDLLRAAFPGGSVTGCPRLRAMEALDAIEPTRRGIYCGALGWASAEAAVLNLPIRTMTLSGGVATLHAGGGIVADSDPESEYRETLDKARGMLQAIGAILPPS